MAYIWQNYSDNKKYRIATESISPYVEVWENSGDTVLVNVFYRLYDCLFPEQYGSEIELFNDLFEKYLNTPKYSELANILMHFLARLDLQHGWDCFDILSCIEKERIDNGVYGCQIKDIFNRIRDNSSKNKLLRYLAKYDFEEQRETVWDAAMYAIFKNVEFYYEKSTSIVHICLSVEKNEQNELLYYICELLFKDLYLKVCVHWNEKIAIIGNDDFMKIGSISYID